MILILPGEKYIWNPLTFLSSVRTTSTIIFVMWKIRAHCWKYVSVCNTKLRCCPERERKTITVTLGVGGNQARWSSLQNMKCTGRSRIQIQLLQPYVCLNLPSSTPWLTPKPTQLHPLIPKPTPKPTQLHPSDLDPTESPFARKR